MASDDLPEPETPVSTTSAFFGIETVMCLRLCWRAPVMTMRSGSNAVCSFGLACTEAKGNHVSPACRAGRAHVSGGSQYGAISPLNVPAVNVTIFAITQSRSNRTNGLDLRDAAKKGVLCASIPRI